MLPLEQVDVLLQHFPDLPVFPAEQDDKRKVSAAWMIESCGWKGFRDGDLRGSQPRAGAGQPRQCQRR